jgi:hypothetical protein
MGMGRTPTQKGNDALAALTSCYRATYKPGKVSVGSSAIWETVGQSRRGILNRMAASTQECPQSLVTCAEYAPIGEEPLFLQLRL